MYARIAPLERGAAGRARGQAGSRIEGCDSDPCGVRAARAVGTVPAVHALQPTLDRSSASRRGADALLQHAACLYTHRYPACDMTRVL
jgi:hypothetical protein